MGYLSIASRWAGGISLPSHLYLALLSTLISLFILWLVYLSLRFFIKKHIEDLKERYKWRVRLFYSLMVLSILVILTIWVNGLQQIFTLLSLIFIALMVTQKETIMNIVGFFLILGRKLFRPGNRVRVGQFYGDVTDIGLLYYTLIECDVSYSGDQSTGRILKVPNNTVITTAVSNLSEPFPYIWSEFTVVITPESDLKLCEEILLDIIKVPTDTLYTSAKSKLLDYANRHYLIDVTFKTKIYTTIKQDKPCGIALTVRFLCKIKDEKELKSLLNRRLIEAIVDKPIKLSFTS